MAAKEEERWHAAVGYGDEMHVGTLLVKETEKRCRVVDRRGFDYGLLRHTDNQPGSFHATKRDALTALRESLAKKREDLMGKVNTLMDQIKAVDEMLEDTNAD